MGDSTGGHESPHALNSYKDNVRYDFFKVIFEHKTASDKSTIMYITAEHLVVSLHLFINHIIQKSFKSDLICKFLQLEFSILSITL
ncbi:hypothetical protein M8J76_007351 [Diaphorina citri]|nr:hypothetical protein M8J75_004001 [Diaphorina citri]KAI5719205.1 hypothetical protein M8J76_006794 [Diaphorina citri]KAI5738133.1 hypothetical protein M8J77_003400 [Diaphorina citri]KAI5745007.1 hypothetical protein M8J76_007351 [Diaphorina citri]KAI5751276.1 hypothetical protein M8J77_006008 [Diaphorina citri]